MAFYSEGLRFTCARCSACCRYESGYVFLSRADAQALTGATGMDYGGFVQTYCRWVDMGGVERLSLKEKAEQAESFDCIFWNSGCAVYDSRPLQCRTFPFWPSILASRQAWDQAKTGCPGMDTGRLYRAADIEKLLEAQEAAAPLSRGVQRGREQC